MLMLHEQYYHSARFFLKVKSKAMEMEVFVNQNALAPLLFSVCLPFSRTLNEMGFFPIWLEIFY